MSKSRKLNDVNMPLAAWRLKTQDCWVIYINSK
jgi:hypothetical protein